MSIRDKRIDAYIARSAEFARPILAHVREVVHAACPACEETLKWSMPFFCYQGKNLCFMAAFTGHAGFGFWRAPLVMGKDEVNDGAMGSFGRLTSVKDLPAKRVLAAYVKNAMQLAEAGAKPKAKAAPKSKASAKAKSAPKAKAATKAKAAPRG